MAETIVKRRALLFIGGYEPISAETRYRRFIRESKRFEKTWNAKLAVSPMTISKDNAIACWDIDTTGANWRTETKYRLLCWDDFVVADFKRSALQRVSKGFFALVDFIFSGTARRYFRVSPRYGFFFLCPVLIIAGAAMLSALVPYLLLHFGILSSGYLAFVLAILTFAALIFLSGRFLLLNYMLDDWIFAAELIGEKRGALEERLDRFAREIAKCVNDSKYDEVIIVAHSLGGALIVEALSRALELDPLLGTRGSKLWVVGVGSSLLKVGLHPKAGSIRAAVQKVAEAPGVHWLEYQTVVDVISFYKVNPVAAMGLPCGRNPMVQNVRMREMLTADTYRQFRGDFFRLHRQWIMGNEARYFYDYFQICCGPASFGRRAGDHYLACYFRKDGSYDAESGPGDAIRQLNDHLAERP